MIVNAQHMKRTTVVQNS